MNITLALITTSRCKLLEKRALTSNNVVPDSIVSTESFLNNSVEIVRRVCLINRQSQRDEKTRFTTKDNRDQFLVSQSNIMCKAAYVKVDQPKTTFQYVTDSSKLISTCSRMFDHTSSGLTFVSHTEVKVEVCIFSSDHCEPMTTPNDNVLFVIQID